MGIKFTGNGDSDVKKSPSNTGWPTSGSRSSGSDIRFTGKGDSDVGKVNSKTMPSTKSADKGGPIKFTGDN